ncbi:MAG: MipA/OmpV family protein [Caulobacteraceae bacterium]
MASGLTTGAARAEGWIVTVGGRIAAYPPYEGAGHDVFVPSPMLSVRRADSPDRFEPPDGGSSLALISNRYVVAGPLVRFRLSRGDTGKLTGLDTIGFAAEPGAFLELWPTNWLRGRVEGRRGIVGHQGWVGDAALDLVHTGKRWSASIGPRIGYGDATYFDTYFGVTPAEAARAPFINTPYEPGGGRRYTGVEVALARHLSKRWVTTFDVGYHRLAKTAAVSPIIEVAGSPNDLSAGLSLTYSFNVFK